MPSRFYLVFADSGLFSTFSYTYSFCYFFTKLWYSVVLYRPHSTHYTYMQTEQGVLMLMMMVWCYIKT